MELTKIINVRIRLDNDEKKYISDHAADMRVEDIAEYIGCSVVTVYRYKNTNNLPKSNVRKRHKRKWTKEKAKNFVKMYNSNIDTASIIKKYKLGSELNVKRRAYYLAQKYGFTIKRKFRDKEQIVSAFENTNGSVPKMSKMLGVSQRTVWRRIREYNILQHI